MAGREHGMTAEQIDAYQQRWGKGPHVAADLVVVSVPWERPDPALNVLLIRRAHDPFQGAHALPGGFVEMDEDLEAAARRELSEETGLGDLSAGWVEQLQTYGLPKRDPRARVVSIVYLAMVPWHALKPPKAGDDASEARFVRLKGGEALDENGRGVVMAFDHDLALREVRARLRVLGSYSSAPMLLLGPSFTLEQARQVYELVLETSLEPAVFESWVQAQRWLELVEIPKGGGERGAERYRLRARKPSWLPPMSR
jgi:8-oxo-dGTP diphosphatase